MDIQQYIAADKELLLNLNGSQSLFWDGFMWVATSTIVWVPVAAMLLYIIIKNNKIQEALLTIIMIALVITLADQIASGLCKPFFARFRPTQDPNIMYMVDIVSRYDCDSYTQSIISKLTIINLHIVKNSTKRFVLCIFLIKFIP